MVGTIETRVVSHAWEAICYSFGCLLSEEQWREVHEKLKSFEVLNFQSSLLFLGVGQRNGSVLYAFNEVRVAYEDHR